MKIEVIPVVLFVYSRVEQTRRVLECLRANGVKKIIVFSDGPKRSLDVVAVGEVRAEIRAISWAETVLVEREVNLGLGANILSGVSDIAQKYEAFIVWEDDLVCVPGTYEWMSAALRHYADDTKVGSVTGWTHPRLVPRGVVGEPYFDGRAECWVWGTWDRAWRGMLERTALEKMHEAQSIGIDPDAYGADLPVMAAVELEKNIWAVRWLYHHIAKRLVCLRPPWSMVEHIGLGGGATNAGQAQEWSNPDLRAAPRIPDVWPEPREDASCQSLWQSATREGPHQLLRRVVRWLGRHVASLRG